MMMIMILINDSNEEMMKKQWKYCNGIDTIKCAMMTCNDERSDIDRSNNETKRKANDKPVLMYSMVLYWNDNVTAAALNDVTVLMILMKTDMILWRILLMAWQWSVIMQ